jgi:hypothetical protein
MDKGQNNWDLTPIFPRSASTSDAPKIGWTSRPTISLPAGALQAASRCRLKPFPDTPRSTNPTRHALGVDRPDEPYNTLAQAPAGVRQIQKNKHPRARRVLSGWTAYCLGRDIQSIPLGALIAAKAQPISHPPPSCLPTSERPNHGKRSFCPRSMNEGHCNCFRHTIDKTRHRAAAIDMRRRYCGACCCCKPKVQAQAEKIGI